MNTHNHPAAVTLNLWNAGTEPDYYVVYLTDLDHAEFIAYLAENSRTITVRPSIFGLSQHSKYTVKLTECELIYVKLAYNARVVPDAVDMLPGTYNKHYAYTPPDRRTR